MPIALNIKSLIFTSLACLLTPIFLLLTPVTSSTLIQSSTVSAAPCTPGPKNPSCICTSQGCDDGKSTAPTNLNLKNNFIVKDIQLIVNVLSIGVGIIVIGVIIFGGIRYAMAGDSPEAVSKAKQHIINGLIALVAYIFTFAFLQWVVPGGIF